MGLPINSVGEPTHHAGSRLFHASAVIWSVYEDRHPHFGSSLIFESDRCARRVREYPRNWRDLSDEQLLALSWMR